MTNESLTLGAQARLLRGKQVKSLRESGQLPVVVYGHETESTPLLVDAKRFKQLYSQAGSTSLVDLTLDEKTVKVLIHEVQLAPVRGEILHADLYAPNLKEEVETEVPLKFVGEAAAVRELEGSLVTNLTELTVRALPTDLPHELEVDISILKTFDDLIHVSDVVVPAGVTITDDPEVTIALVNPPRSEEELKAELEADAGAAEQAVVAELGKEPEKPAEEGETPAEGEAKAEEKPAE